MLAAFSITPGVVGDSVGDFVAEAVRIVRASGLPNRTSAMFTEIEGEWPEIAAVIGQCINAMERLGAPRVSVVVKVDHRPGHHGMLDSKVAAVERRLSEGPPP